VRNKDMFCGTSARTLSLLSVNMKNVAMESRARLKD
jgi:hypothetical protein